MRRLIGLALVCALIATPALAEDTASSAPADAPSQPATVVPENLQPFVGDWLIEQDEESAPRCPIRFLDAEAIGGYAVELPETCPEPFPASDLAAWTVDDADAILLLDPLRNVVLKFEPDADGVYVTPEISGPRFYLVSPYDEDGAGGEQDAD